MFVFLNFIWKEHPLMLLKCYSCVSRGCLVSFPWLSCIQASVCWVVRLLTWFFMSSSALGFAHPHRLHISFIPACAATFCSFWLYDLPFFWLLVPHSSKDKNHLFFLSLVGWYRAVLSFTPFAGTLNITVVCNPHCLYTSLGTFLLMKFISFLVPYWEHEVFQTHIELLVKMVE